MRVKKDEIAVRWERLSGRVRSRALADEWVHDLAQRAGFDWYFARGDETLAEFLEHDGEGIFQLYGLGKTKVSRLCDILEKLTDGDEDVVIDLPRPISPVESLDKWVVSLDFPYDLISLPIRLCHYFEENGITTLGGILEQWARLGATGFKAERNIGRKSVNELGAFVDSLVSGNVEVVSRFLPLGSEGVGTDLAASLVHVLVDRSPVELEMLERRLQEGLTLEESAETLDLTRERVRQVESKFLQQVQRRLDHYTSRRDEILDAWMGSEDWFALVRWNGNPDFGLLAKAALESIFRDSPQGVARELSDEARMENLEDLLESSPDLWFGGTRLEEFLRDVNADERATFCEQVAAGSRFRLDQATGRVHPARTDLRRCMAAMVGEEDDPIPLTWIVELVRKTGYHPRLERIDALRRRSSWRKRDDFPDEMILWRE